MPKKSSKKVARTAICFSLTVSRSAQHEFEEIIENLLDDLDVDVSGHLDWLVWQTKKPTVCLGVLFAPLTAKASLKELVDDDEDLRVSMLSVARILKTETMKAINCSVEGVVDTKTAKDQIRNWNIGSDDEVKNPINDLDVGLIDVGPKKQKESWQSYTDRLVKRVRNEQEGKEHLTQKRLSG